MAVFRWSCFVRAFAGGGVCRELPGGLGRFFAIAIACCTEAGQNCPSGPCPSEDPCAVRPNLVILPTAARRQSKHAGRHSPTRRSAEHRPVSVSPDRQSNGSTIPRATAGNTAAVNTHADLGPLSQNLSPGSTTHCTAPLPACQEGRAIRSDERPTRRAARKGGVGSPSAVPIAAGGNCPCLTFPACPAAVAGRRGW